MNFHQMTVAISFQKIANFDVNKKIFVVFKQKNTNLQIQKYIKIEENKIILYLYVHLNEKIKHNFVNTSDFWMICFNYINLIKVK